MDFRKLHYFVVTAQEQSISKAALLLHISQPSLSHSIKKLEEEIKFSLFERTAKGIELTESGERFYIRAREILQHVHNVQIEMEEIQQMGEGKLSVGLIESVRNWLPKKIADYTKEHPKLKIELKEILTPEAIEQALNRLDVHFVISNQQFTSELIHTRELYMEPLVIGMNRHHPLARSRQLYLDDLAAESFIVSSHGQQTAENLIQLFQRHNMTPKIQFEIERFEMACRLIEQNVGIALLPINSVKSYHSTELIYKTIQNESLYRTIYLMTLKKRYLPPVVDEFIQRLLTTEISELIDHHRLIEPC
ncbi:LysR family transcriptional regulator [Bacillus aerolatus]|uniref:LysR family transcriptional regulator n=1 Tax=Bacillus aerolatus TaxID=2653354 RepID=A0A6I1FPC5_9BACI|nr:LysR family transcriptional regulator [Bacillus aerolatus]KAB7706140.1 LysR family transcriptional regulator [Bacillus aerolatus]